MNTTAHGVGRTRPCVSPECDRRGLLLSWSEFDPAAVWEDGTMRRPRSLCRRCDRRRARIRQARRRAENPERENARVRKSKRLAKRRRANDGEGTRRLPFAPWRAWLLDQLAALDRAGVAYPIADLTIRLGISERRMTRWLHECSTFIVLDDVDAALCEFGDPLALRDIYPELYDNGRVVA